VLIVPGLRDASEQPKESHAQVMAYLTCPLKPTVARKVTHRECVFLLETANSGRLGDFGFLAL
jgi:hypothetical protein